MNPRQVVGELVNRGIAALRERGGNWVGEAVERVHDRGKAFGPIECYQRALMTIAELVHEVRCDDPIPPGAHAPAVAALGSLDLAREGRIGAVQGVDRTVALPALPEEEVVV